MTERKTERHPSYGLVGFYRVSHGGKNKLFASRLNNHPTTIIMRVFQAKVDHDLSRDWIYADRQTPIVELELSPAQFSELLTTMNVGDGVPCTIRYCRDGKTSRIGPVPEEHLAEQEKIYNGFKDQLSEFLNSIDDRKKRLDELLGKKGKLTAKERDEIRGLSMGLFRFFYDHAPFILKSFEKSAEKVASEAKSSIDHFVTTAITKLGLESLKDRLTPRSSLEGLLGIGEEPVDPAGEAVLDHMKGGHKLDPIDEGSFLPTTRVCRNCNHWKPLGVARNPTNPGGYCRKHNNKLVDGSEPGCDDWEID